MTTISLCMIVKNEEDVLERCLSSVKDKVNEIIIIDTGSIDDTVEIARKFTDKIFDFKWIDDFSAARNESIKYATSDYILVMDADEYLDNEADLNTDLIQDCDYYYSNVKNLLSGEQAFTHSTVRIFRNNFNFKYENRLHEHISLDNGEIDYKVGKSKCIIYHTGYSQKRMNEKDKHNRNLKLMLKEVKENPTAFNLFNMGKTYLLVSDYANAAEYLQRAYPLSLNRVYFPELLMRLAQSLFEIGNQNEAISVLKGGTVLFPEETEMRFTQGLLYKRVFNYKDSELCFLKCLELGDKGTTVTEGSGGYLSHLQLIDIYLELGEFNKAYSNALKALKEKFIVSVAKYLQISKQLSIPLEEVKVSINKLYKIENVNDLQFLIEILYRVRSPLFNDYLEKYNVEPQMHVMFVAKLYSNNYEEAFELLNNMDDINSEIAMDVLIFAYMLKDNSLLNKIQFHLNLGKSEMKLIKQLLNRESLSGHMNTNIENIIFYLLKELIVLKEFEVFQSLCEQLISYDNKYQIKLSELLIQYRFDELAIDMLNQTFKTETNNTTVLRLLGDLCLRNRYMEDAEFFYLNLIKLDCSYSSYERVYKLYESLNDTDNALKIKREIATKFPLVSWAEESIS
ncbi:glycosyltransferase involved in cell wall biosynthesis [Paenibacillus turicensis]|uniref:Glycosyltransferase involved in cell wall biosynthesis n=2 Tax=Paenibacillus turicensis TaxID=160487 RepID=A0ABS4FXP2_9BACL|nr:glycosyltransferase involved in cell wall biosynthesis [Paenibacillus turicensis]